LIRNVKVMVALAAVAAGVAVTVPLASSASASTGSAMSCRSNTAGQYWLDGVESDACDGQSGSAFRADASTNLYHGTALNGGPVSKCIVQLNRVVNGVASPVSGSSNSAASSDGVHCLVSDDWHLPAGYYNSTASYIHNGVPIETVAGPVKWYPGG